MKLEKYLNKFITIEFSDKKKSVSGFLLDYSDEWILLQSNVVDFVIDGYTIIRNKKIEGIYREEDEIFKENVIKLKGILPKIDKKVPLENTVALFKFLNDEYGIFLLSKKSDSAVYPGRLLAMDESQIAIEWIDLKGKWTENRAFKLDKIRMIEFNSDYLISLKLASEKLYN